MKKIAILLALMLVLGAVFISGCTISQNNTSSNSSGQNKSPNMPGYSVGHIISIESGTIASETELELIKNK